MTLNQLRALNLIMGMLKLIMLNVMDLERASEHIDRCDKLFYEIREDVIESMQEGFVSDER